MIRSLLRCLPGSALLILSMLVATGAARAAETAELEKQYRDTVVPFLQNYCLDCHSGDSAEADLDFEHFKSLADVTTVGRKKWNTVLDLLTTGDMPPVDAEQPPAEELHAVLDWVKDALSQVDCSGPVNPGRETMRRLNRIEYQNTIRDLVGVDFEANQSFPADDVGYGFDNIGDVLSISPLLFEKYYEAADTIARKAIITDEKDLYPRLELPLKEFQLEKGENKSGNRLTFPSNNAGRYMLEVDPGPYILEVYAHASQAGDEPAKMRVRIGPREDKTFSIRNTAANNQPVELRVRLPKGPQGLEVAFLNDFYDPDASDPNRRDRNLYINKIVLVGPLRVTEEMYPDTHKAIVFVKPGQNGLTEIQAAQQVISRFASRAFRRPVTANEMERLTILYNLAKGEGMSYEECIREVVTGILCSSHFLFKVEEGPADQVYALNDYQLATRLSYFLWSTMPDDQLLALAWKGTLRQNLDAQVTRMLKDPRSEALVKNFAGQWLEMRKLETVQPDRQKFRGYTPRLAEDMRRETELFFKSIIEEDRSVLELISADYTFLNERLAKHYKIDGVTGEEFQKVVLKDKNRGGLLTHASVLTVTSNPTRTSPVKRGRWILDNLLGAPPPEAPADIPTLESQKKLTGSLREQMKQHRENPACASCHSRMDPIGFSLENFDAVGAWRTKDGNFDIDASSEFPGGIKFEGAGGLKKLILDEKKDDFIHNMVSKTMTYALGRGVEYYDECAIQQVMTEMANNDNRFSALIRGIVHSEPFQKRGG